MTRDSGASSFQRVQIAPAFNRINRQTRGVNSGLPSLQRLAPSGSQTPQPFVPTMEDIVEEELSRTALTQFYQRGITGDYPLTYKEASTYGLCIVQPRRFKVSAASHFKPSPSRYRPFP